MYAGVPTIAPAQGEVFGEQARGSRREHRRVRLDGRCGLERPGEAEVDHVGDCVGVDQNVAGLEVSMDKARSVSGREPLAGIP